MPEQIAFVDLPREHAALQGELSAAFDRVRERGAFILGEEVDAFERDFANYCGARNCVGVASGTAALSLTLAAAGIGAGDEVIVPAHTFVASAFAVLHAGATPVLCDVERGTGLMDPDSAANAVTERTAAVLPVHLYGQMCHMPAVHAFAERHGLAVVEDAAQAHGATCHQRGPGSDSLAACFSFYPSKNLGALGDGGAVCTNDDGLAAQVRELRDLGQRGKGEHVSVGYNERLDGLQAALLRVKLPHLNAANAARRRHAASYRELLAGSATVLEERKGTPCVYHLFPVRVPDRDALAAALTEAGVQTGVHYSPTLAGQPAIATGDGHFPEAEAWAQEELSLPIFPSLRADELERVVGVLLGHVRGTAAAS